VRGLFDKLNKSKRPVPPKDIYPHRAPPAPETMGHPFCRALAQACTGLRSEILFVLWFTCSVCIMRVQRIRESDLAFVE